MATRLLSLEKAMISQENVLKDETKDENENVSGLKGMLYSVPGNIYKNRHIYELFLGEFNDEKDNAKSTKESINAKGARVRNLILNKEDDEAKEDTDTTSLYDSSSTESEEETKGKAKKKPTEEPEEEEEEENSTPDEDESEDEEDENSTPDEDESEDDESEEEEEENSTPDEDEGEDGESEEEEDEAEDEDIEEIKEIKDIEDIEDIEDIKNKDDEDEDDDDDDYPYSKYSKYRFDDDDDDDDDEENRKYSEEEDDVFDSKDISRYEQKEGRDKETYNEGDYDYGVTNKSSTSNTTEKSEGEKGEKKPYEWQDDGDIDDEAGELRDSARDLVSNHGGYGIATEQGIDALDGFLNKVLAYSSKISQRTNPIKELIRNFNSIKTIQRTMVGNQQDLEIVATNLDEIKKNANEVSRAQAAKISMQNTYLNKIIALNRFEYSEELETLLRNALFDIYKNVLEKKNGSEKDLTRATNVGRILLPLLRTKNEPEDYNYDFQYDVLKEIIRQEDFFGEFNSRSDDDEKSLKTNPISTFIFLRYLKTLLYYPAEEDNIKAKQDKGASAPKKEFLNNNLETAFGKVLESGDYNDGIKIKADSTYEPYLKNFKYIVDNYENDNSSKTTKKRKKAEQTDLQELLGNINEKMQESFRGVTTQLNPKNSSGGVVRVKEIVKLLKKLKDEIGSSQKALYNKLANIIDSSKDPEKLVQACGQNNKIFENLKKAYDESLSTNSAPENEKKEKTKTTDTQSTAKTAKK